jgi:D-arabinose 1-dehydrogenase-like Zn-dependent alcohol dehydrogenase
LGGWRLGGGCLCLLVSSFTFHISTWFKSNLLTRTRSAVGDVPIDTTSLVIKGQSVHGWPSGHALDSEEAIQFAELQGVNCMVQEFPFDKVEEAVQRMMSNEVRFRSVVVME